MIFSLRMSEHGVIGVMCCDKQGLALEGIFFFFFFFFFFTYNTYNIYSAVLTLQYLYYKQ